MNIVIVDKYPVVRQGIISILTNEKNIYRIKEASNIEEAMSIIANGEIDIAIVDPRLGDEDGFAIAARAKYMELKTKFIIFTEAMAEKDIKRTEQLRIDGYILKEALAEDILYAISVINRGKKYYYSEILRYNQCSAKKDN